MLDWWRWRSPLFMPRWASRIDLEITDVRVQRLQDISPADIMAEGIQERMDGQQGIRAHMADAWDVINGKRSPWSRNDWVWALTFRRVRP